MNDWSADGRIGFEVDGTTLTVRDAIEGKRMRIRVDREPDLSSALTALFPLPVDRAVSFEAESVSVAEYSSIILRDDEGEFVGRTNEATELPRGSYYIEITGTTKAYVRVNDVEIAMSGMRGSDPIEFAFDRPRTVTVGARSFHTRPEATITVPDDPSALAEAVSVLGSSIREFSPERSWPTLRGYPPRIERGDALDIPSPLVAPDTGIEVIVRPTYADVYRLSTLSFYLGARMRTGDAPAIRLDNGYEERLPTERRALEARVEELSRTWFFLDTLARIEGYTPSNRYEYEAVGSDLPFYPPNLADLSMSERLMEYLEVDAETVAPYAPAWPTEATLRPTPAAAELLPHLARVLAPVRVRGAAKPTRSDAPIGLATPGWDSPPDPAPNPETDPIPAGTSVLTPATYETRLRRELADRGEVRVAFLLDDDERARKLRHSLTTPAVPDGIGSWSVDVSPNRNAVAGTLSDPSLDLVLCGLPTRNGVVEAADGPVEIQSGSAGSDLSAPAVSVFEGTDDVTPVLDSVDRGGIGGATFDSTIAPDRIRSFVGLLAAGCPVVAAARLALDSTGPAARFVGDSGMAVATDRRLPTQVFPCHPTAPDSFQVRSRTFLSTEVLLGTDYQVVSELFDSTPSLAGKERTVGETDASGILRIHDEKGPVLHLFGDIFLQNDGLTVEEIEASARRALAADDPPESNSGSGVESQCRD
ncbi:hypothetical protein [Halorubrum sp. 2020YC2]|uniref:hypothetical protein n=1 Tax=Halorubrum sp. 2020YC2 TaxID=2836432 RepID=UPI001BE841D8|nr:hypothetical protein [Halorubrum sp. 2020YC2]QWC20060.1 hypothetical protein KI388_03630 [Halorubrum sp. 2020YC2]